MDALPYRLLLRSDPTCMVNIPFVYFHGQLQDSLDAHQRGKGWAFDAPDLVGTDSLAYVQKRMLGSFWLKVYDIPACAFFWEASGRMRGLIVASADHADREYALAKYTAKDAML